MITENYHLVVRGIDDFHDYTTIHKQRYDGILLMSQSEHDEAFIHHVKKQGIPIIVLNRRVESNQVMNILADDGEGHIKLHTISFSRGINKLPLLKGKKGLNPHRKEKLVFCKHSLTIMYP